MHVNADLLKHKFYEPKAFMLLGICFIRKGKLSGVTCISIKFESITVSVPLTIKTSLSVKIGITLYQWEVLINRNTLGNVPCWINDHGSWCR